MCHIDLIFIDTTKLQRTTEISQPLNDKLIKLQTQFCFNVVAYEVIHLKESHTQNLMITELALDIL